MTAFCPGSLFTFVSLALCFLTTKVLAQNDLGGERTFTGCISNGGTLTFSARCTDERLEVRTVSFRSVSSDRQTTDSDGQCELVETDPSDCVDTSDRPKITTNNIRKECNSLDTCSYDINHFTIAACNSTYSNVVHVKIIYQCWSARNSAGVVVTPLDPTRQDIIGGDPTDLIVLQSSGYPSQDTTMLNVTCQVAIEEGFELLVYTHDLSAEAVFQRWYDCPYTFNVKTYHLCAERGAVYLPRGIYDPDKRTAIIQFRRSQGGIPREAFQARFWIELRASDVTRYDHNANGISLSCTRHPESSSETTATPTPPGDSALATYSRTNLLGSLVMLILSAGIAFSSATF